MTVQLRILKNGVSKSFAYTPAIGQSRLANEWGKFHPFIFDIFMTSILNVFSIIAICFSFQKKYYLIKLLNFDKKMKFGRKKMKFGRRNSESKLEIGTRNRNSKSKHEIETRNQNTKSKHFITNLGEYGKLV